MLCSRLSHERETGTLNELKRSSSKLRVPSFSADCVPVRLGFEVRMERNCVLMTRGSNGPPHKRSAEYLSIESNLSFASGTRMGISANLQKRFHSLRSSSSFLVIVHDRDVPFVG